MSIAPAPLADFRAELLKLSKFQTGEESEILTQWHALGSAAARNGLALDDILSSALITLTETETVSADNYQKIGRKLAALAEGLASPSETNSSRSEKDSRLDYRLLSRLNALHRISRAATTTTSAIEYLSQSIEAIREVTAADALTVFVFDRPTSSLALAGQFGFDPALVGTMTIRGDRGIIGQVLASGNAVFASQVTDHPEWIPSPLLHDEKYRTQASLPMTLVNPDRIVGIFTLWTLETHDFDEDEQAFLKDVATELAIGVEYTQLHSLTDERLRRKIIELGTLQRVSRTVASALDLNDVLRFVSESAVELTNAESAAVFRLSSPGQEESSSPVVEYRVGTARQVADQTSRDALLNDVMRSGSARAVGMDYVDGSSILYCMPLSSARERWGALCVRLKPGMEVTEDDLALLQAFTDTASIAIENAELYEEARRSAETASTLLQEMHHRVRNNLQTVAALISLQLRQVEGSETERHLQDAIGRVQAIASVHDLLSDERRLSGATIDAIARLVADELKVTLIPPSTHVTFDIGRTDVVVPTRQATVLALLFNELISNSIEHGFAGKKHGRIVIRTWKIGNLISIEVENDGNALPAGFDPNGKAGIGLRIIQRLVESDLKGEFSLERGIDSTIARMVFPASD